MTEKDTNSCGCCGCGDHDHEHDHDHGEIELETMLLTFEDENGEDVELELGVMDIFEVDGKEYIALVLPEFFVYLYSEDEDGEPILDVIENDDDFDKVSVKFEELFFMDEE